MSCRNGKGPSVLSMNVLESIGNGANTPFASFSMKNLTTNDNYAPTLRYELNDSVPQAVTSKLNLCIIKTSIFCSSEQVWVHSPDDCISHSFLCQTVHHCSLSTTAAFSESQFIVVRVQSFFHLLFSSAIRPLSY